ncbi:MAG: MFS transporter [Candidatus Omnitrophica bacterium]|nr:MFS transporter [Candidatus Omnitrophota bacterium]
MSQFTDILRNRNFFLLWLGQIVSQLGDRLNQMALIALVYSRTPGSALSLAKTISFTIIPVFIIGPIAGVYVDRWDRRRTMYLADLIRAFFVFLIAAIFIEQGLGWIYLAIFLIFSVGRFFVPAKMAIIPEIVSQQHLVIANSLVHTTGMIAAVVAFGISGIVVERLGPQGGFYLDALSFLFSAFCIFLLTTKTNSYIELSCLSTDIVHALKDSVMIKKSVLRDIKEGLIYFLNNQKLLITAIIIFFLWSAVGSIYAVIIVFIQKTLGSATKDLGLLIMFLGSGLFGGSLMYGRMGQNLCPYKTIFYSLITSGIMLVVFTLIVASTRSFAWAGILAVLLGVIVSPIMIATNTIVHVVSDKNMLGKTFSSLEIIIHLGFIICMFVSSILAERITAQNILITTGIITTLIGTIQLIIFNKKRWLLF